MGNQSSNIYSNLCVKYCNCNDIDAINRELETSFANQENVDNIEEKHKMPIKSVLENEDQLNELNATVAPSNTTTEDIFNDLIMFYDYMELIIIGYIRIKCRNKYHKISSNIMYLIRQYNTTNWKHMNNISVIIRIKPYIATEIDLLLMEENENENPDENIKIDHNIITIQYQNDKYANQYSRQYDYILDHNTTQRKLYLSTAAPLIQACVDGYNITVFAYGADDCGKSYAIFGSHSQFGIAQRCMSDLLHQLNMKHILNKIASFKIVFSGLKIYDKKLYDLFDDSDTEKTICIKSEFAENGNKINYTFVDGLFEIEVVSLEEALIVIYKCIVEQNSVNDTYFDTILIIKAEQIINNGDGSGQTIQSEIKLVKCKAGDFVSTGNEFDMYDLLRKTDFKTKKMYTESPFNYLMSDSFAGNRITVMIGCISSDIKNVKKTIGTLKYGSDVMKIKNKPTANINDWWDIFIQPQLMIAPFKLTIDPTKTFGEIKYDISQLQHINIAANQIVLMWDGNYLSNSQTLMDSNVLKQEVIYLSKQESASRPSLEIGTTLDLSTRSLV